MAMDECSVHSSLQADSEVKFAAWPTSWWPPGADRLSLGGPCVLLLLFLGKLKIKIIQNYRLSVRAVRVWLGVL